MSSLAVIPVDELKALVTEAVATALAAHDRAPRLLTRDGLARALGCSANHVDHLRKRGLPEVRLGQAAVRFELGAVLEWIRRQPAENDRG